MKKLKPTTAKRIHPSPPPPPASPFSLLPSALLAVAAALSPHDQDTLAYLLDCQKPHTDSDQRRSRRGRRQANHQPQLGCACFGCYKSYWARWDASPNRHVIDTIIDAFEESLEPPPLPSEDRADAGGRARGGRRRRSGKAKKKGEALAAEKVEDRDASAKIEEDEDGDGDDEEEAAEEEEVAEGEGKSSVRRFVSWVFGMSD